MDNAPDPSKERQQTAEGKRVPGKFVAASTAHEQEEAVLHEAVRFAQSTIDALIAGRRPEGMPADETAAWEFVAEFYANKAVSDATYDRALAQFGEEALMDLLGVMGYYSMIAMVMTCEYPA